jgi:hypothetical protein
MNKSDNNKYISSARTLSLLAILITYVGWDLGYSDSKRLQMLFGLRQELAAAIVENHIQTHPALRLQGGRFQFDDQGPDRYIPGIGSYSIEERDLLDEPGVVVVISDLYGKKRWATLIPAEDLPDKNEINLKFKSIAFEMGLIPEENIDLHQLYLNIEEKLLGERVQIPGTGYHFQKKLAIWIAAISVLSIFALIRNRIRQVVFNQEVGSDEPWLILGDKLGIEKVIATCWLMSLLICPWVIFSGLLIREVSQLTVDGATFPLWRDLTIFLVISSLMTVCGWISLTTVSMVLRLRNRLLIMKE